MNDKNFTLEIVTPTRLVYSGEARHVRIPGVEGSFGVLDRHAPFLTALQIGGIKVESSKGTRSFATSGGIVEVLPHAVTILAETADEAGEIDLARAEAAKERAKRRLRERTPDVDLDRARRALSRATNRIRLVRKLNGMR